MKITKTTTKTYEVIFYPDTLPDMTWGRFRSVRERNGQINTKLEKCFCCGHAFSDDENMVFVTVKSIGNRFACRACLEKDKEEAEQ